MSIRDSLNLNTLRFSILYALAMSVAGIDLSLTVRSGKELTHSAIGGTGAYVMLGCGTIIAARIGMPLIFTYGLRRTYMALAGLCTVSGLLTTLAVTYRLSALFYFSLLTVGVFMGLSYYHRLLVRDLSRKSSPWDTSLVLITGIIGAIVGPMLTGILSPGIDLFYRSYLVVSAIGLLSMAVAATLPRTMNTRAAAPAATKNNHNEEPPNDKPDLYLGGVVGFGSYASMTLIMTAVPLEASTGGAHGHAISSLTQIHMVAMYLPILVAAATIAHSSSRVVAWSAATITIISLVVVQLVAGVSNTGHHALAAYMIIAGVTWGFGYTAASDLVAGSRFGKTHPQARGRVEILPPVGMVMGSLLAGVLLQYSSFAWVVFTTIGFSVVMIAALATERTTRNKYVG